MNVTIKNDRGIVKNIMRRQHVVDGAGVKINRIIGSHTLEHIDPFVLLDEIKSNDPADYRAGFPTHPHRGIETITYMIKGNFRHRDSHGGGGLLSDGCVQWMTAGKGILHSEMPEDTEGGLWGFQLWLSLPAKDKMVDPRYQHLSPEMIPSIKGNGISVKVISGTFNGVQGPAKNWLEADYFDVSLDKGSTFTCDIDKKMNRACYVHTGSVIINPSGGKTKVNEGELAELHNSDYIDIQGATDHAGFLFLASYPNNEPIVRGGPFVMNSEEEIMQAFDDYRNGVIG